MAHALSDADLEDDSSDCLHTTRELASFRAFRMRREKRRETRKRERERARERERRERKRAGESERKREREREREDRERNREKERDDPTTYAWPGSNWRPSGCEADVIATDHRCSKIYRLIH